MHFTPATGGLKSPDTLLNELLDLNNKMEKSSEDARCFLQYEQICVALYKNGYLEGAATTPIIAQA